MSPEEHEKKELEENENENDSGFDAEMFEDEPPVEEPEPEKEEEELEQEEEEEPSDEPDKEEQDDSAEAEEEETPAPEVEEEEEEPGEPGDVDDEDDLDLGEDLEEEEETELERLRRENAELKAKPTPKAEEPQKEEPPAIPDNLTEAIFGDLDFDEAMADKGKFMQVIENAIKVGRDITHEHVLKSVPNLVVQQTRGYHELLKLNKRFYKANKDLRGFKKTVVATCNEIHSEHPEMRMEEVLAKAAPRARKALGIKKGAKGKPPVPPKKGKKQKPAFANTPKKKKVQEKVSKLQNDINTTLDL